MKSISQLLVAFALLFLLSACAQSTPELTATPVVTITTPPTVTAPSVLEDSDRTLTTDDVAYDARRLTEMVEGEVIPEIPFDGSNSNIAAPEHLRFSIGGALSPEIVPTEGQMLIYPAPDYAEMYRAGGVDTVANQMELLRTLVAQRPLTIEEPLPLLPLIDSTPPLQAHVEFVDFEGGAGVRYLTQLAGDLPVTNDGLFYTFQGLTHDGNYYVAIFYPVNSAALAAMSAEDMEAARASAASDSASYRSSTEQLLTSEDVEAFTPPLPDLDLLISSLLIGSRGGGTGATGAGGGQVEVPPTPTVSTAASGPTAVPNPTVPSEGNTQVIMLRPIPPSFAEDGQCTEPSLTLARADAWRCTVGDQLFDPCVVASDGQTLVCDANPIEGSSGFALRLTAPLPEIEPSPGNDSTAWIVQLVTGAHCTFVSATTGDVGDKRINYVCSDQRVILGDLEIDNGTWYATRADVINNAGTFEASNETRDEIRRVWQ